MTLSTPGKLLFALSMFCLLIGLCVSVSAQDKDWRPVTPAELSTKTSVVEPNADAEAIFWEIRIDDSDSDDLSLRHYVRVKIFTERGREKYSKFDIPFMRGRKIKELAARVVKADGSTVEIRKEDIFEREIIKAGGVKIKAKSFAVPNIEPGVIVEYRYREAIDDAMASGMRLAFQREIPIQKLSYYYKPYNKRDPSYQAYNFTDTKFVKDVNGFWLASRNNVPSFKEEPRMPPEDVVRPWMLLTSTRIGLISASAFSISFTIKDPSNSRSYWGAVAGEKAGLIKFMTKPSGDLKKAATEITAGASSPDEKLKKIYEFCQREVKNTTFDTTLTDDDRRKLPAVKSMSDVLKRRSGSSQYVDLLFGALASAAGFDARVAFTSNRNEMFFTPEMTNESLIHPAAIAVKVGDDWKYYNPGMPFLPHGMLVWYEEDAWALIVGEKDFVWRKTPLTAYGASNTKRIGKFTLLDDGTLEGDVRIEMTGHPALSYRLDKYDESGNKREEDLKKELTGRVSTAEVSSIAIENLEDPSKPIVHRYKVKIPSYAQKTGKRIFMQPGFFEYGSNPLFSSADRKYDIFFRYPWSETDSVEITLPKGFKLDNADSPGKFADPSNIGSVNIRIAVDDKDTFMNYHRAFHFGNGGHVLFDSKNYTALKSLFDAFHKSDTHMITLKQE